MTPTANRYQINVRIGPATAREIAELREWRDDTVSGIIRLAVRELWVREAGRRNPPAIVK